jgi:arginine dihydrolase ArgZ-like protein
MPYPTFDRSRLKLRPLAERQHDMGLDHVLPLGAPARDDPRLEPIAQRVSRAREEGRPVILMMGAHVIKSGVSRHVVDLIKRGMVTHVAMNGAGPIHDFELALIGATTESVARYISEGQFGLWRETGRINDIVRQGAAEGLGIGESLGRAIAEGDFPHRDVSILAAGYRARVPVTVHVGIGYDIIHEHPNFDGAAFGAASYTDFLVFARAVEALEGGVLLCFGSAVMGPEIYLKALAMARNIARQEGRTIARFTTAVFDLLDMPEDYHIEATKDDPRYYYRPFKTILVRTVRDGGESFYIQGDHRATLPGLRHYLVGGGQ